LQTSFSFAINHYRPRWQVVTLPITTKGIKHMKNELFIVMNDGRKISVSGFQNTEEMVSFCSAIDSDLFDYNNIMMNDDSTDEAESDDYYDDSMDGDFDSAMRDAGHGTDEDYGYYGEDYITDETWIGRSRGLGKPSHNCQKLNQPQAQASIQHKPAQAQATSQHKPQARPQASTSTSHKPLHKHRITDQPHRIKGSPHATHTRIHGNQLTTDEDEELRRMDDRASPVQSMARLSEQASSQHKPAQASTSQHKPASQHPAIQPAHPGSRQPAIQPEQASTSQHPATSTSQQTASIQPAIQPQAQAQAQATSTSHKQLGQQQYNNFSPETGK
jgi:hypothetical protein